MTEIIVKVPEQSDLEKLLDFLKSLKLAFTQKETKSLTTAPSLEKELDTEGHLPMEIIKKMYPNEWVLLALLDKDDDEAKGGIVLYHHADLHELVAKGKDLIHNHTYTTHFYTGEFPKRPQIGLIRLKTL
jgi:hypothetical protein